jgi:hypothetical protein
MAPETGDCGLEAADIGAPPQPAIPAR